MLPIVSTPAPRERASLIRHSVRAFIADLFLTARSERSLLRALAYWLIVVAAVVLWYRDVVSGAPAITQGGHAELSMNLAINASFCGTTNRIAPARSIAWSLTARQDLMEEPFSRILAAYAGSVDAYCRSVTQPYVNNENTLMWLIRACLWARPDASPAAVGRALAGMRVAMLLAFGLALLRTGASVMLSAASVLVGCAILRAVELRYAGYPFLLTLPLLSISYYTIADGAVSDRVRPWTLSGIGAGAGLLTAFSVNVRSSHLPIYLSIFALFLFSVLRRMVPRDRKALVRSTAAAAVAFVVGYGVFDQVWIRPLRATADPGVTNYTYHAFAHALVLGLGYPETALSRREGIAWDDMIGLTLARKTTPDVTYLGPTYEQALLKYYGRLWRRHTGLMLDAYAHKLRSAGTEVFLSAALVGTQFGIPRWPAERLHAWTNGIVLMLLCAAMFAVPFRAHLRSDAPLPLAAALVGLTGCFVILESFLTLSIFVAMYFSFLLFTVFFAWLWLVQRGIDHVAARWIRSS